MWWIFVVALALLATQGSECTDEKRRALASESLMEMTEAQIADLSSILLTDFDNAGISCPENARTTLTFALMAPRIPLSPSRIRQMVFQTAPNVHHAAKIKVTHVIMKIVYQFIQPVREMEDLPAMLEILQNIPKKLDKLVMMIEDRTNKVTGNDVIERMESVIKTVKGISCNKMIGLANLEQFLNKVEKVLSIHNEVKLDGKWEARVVKAIQPCIKDDEERPAVIAQAVKVIQLILTDIKSATDKMKTALPRKLPIDIFLKNLVSMSKTVPEISKRDMEGSAETTTATNIAARGLEIPKPTSPCYKQEVAAYNAVLLRVMVHARRKAAMNIAMFQHHDKNLWKLILGRHFLWIDLKSDKKMYGVVRLMRASTQRVLMGWMRLRSEGKMTDTTMIGPINEVLANLTSPVICTADAGKLTTLVRDALNKYQDTFSAASMNKMKNKLAKRLNTTEVNEFMNKLKIADGKFKNVLESMIAEFKSEKITPGPVKSLISIAKDLLQSPVNGSMPGLLRMTRMGGNVTGLHENTTGHYGGSNSKSDSKSGSESHSKRTSATELAIPKTSDKCYKQKLAAYNAVLLRVMVKARRMASMNIAVFLLHDKTKSKQILGRHFLWMDLKSDKKMRGVVRLMKISTHRVLMGWMRLKNEGKMTDTTMIWPINEVLANLTSPVLCTADAGKLTTLVHDALNKYQATFNAASMKAIRDKLARRMNTTLVNEFMSHMKIVNGKFEKVLTPMIAELKAGKISPAPLKSLISLAKDLIQSPGGASKTGLLRMTRISESDDIRGLPEGHDETVRDVVRKYGLSGNEMMAAIPIRLVRPVLIDLAHKLEDRVSQPCQKVMALRFAQGLLRAIVESRVKATRDSIIYTVGRAVHPKNIAMATIRKEIRQEMDKECKDVTKDLSAIKDAAGEMKEVASLLDVDESERLPLAAFLESMFEHASAVVKQEMTHCNDKVNMDAWKNVIKTFTSRMSGVRNSGLTGRIVKLFGNDVAAARTTESLVDTLVTNMYRDLARMFEPMMNLKDPRYIHDIFINVLEMRLRHHKTAYDAGLSKRESVGATAALINNPIFQKIVTKYSEILSKVLEGKTTQPIAESQVEEMLHQVADEIMNPNVKRGMGRSGGEKIANLLSILEGVPMDKVPSDVILNTIIAVGRHMDRTVSQPCRLAVRVKFIAAYLRKEIDDLENARPDHPLITMLVPIMQSSGLSMDLLTVEEVLQKLTAVMHKVSQASMAGLKIFQKTDGVKALLEEVLAKVKPGETANERYHKIKPRLVQILNDQTLCDVTDDREAIKEGREFLHKIGHSDKFEHEELMRTVREVVPESMVEPVVMMLEEKVLPLVEETIHGLMREAAKAVKRQHYFPEFFAHLIVESLELDETPMERMLESPTWILFLERTKDKLMSGLMPISKMPAEVLERMIGFAYMKTLAAMDLRH